MAKIIVQRHPNPPAEAVKEIINYINKYQSLRKAAKEMGFSATYLSSVVRRKIYPSPRLAAICGWQLNSLWSKKTS